MSPLRDSDNVAMNGKSVLGQVLMGLAKVNPLPVAVAVSPVWKSRAPGGDNIATLGALRDNYFQLTALRKQ